MNKLNRYFLWVQDSKYELWWSSKEQKWVSKLTGGCSTSFYCRTAKAFARHLRKHPEIKGRAILVNRYKGYDIYG